ncbi:alpha/beta hydrolase fold family protein [Bordetella holmesii 30539]|uniref:Putative lysophospholipase n=1 Tax=Bordetella holmesii CDC-H585-BH TaxID=1331206 RepID=A0A158M6D8_9BORD|nr:alpha/beta fold hydrolase [Bordetella holmesii]AHV94286.1 alpha/beta hydrolase fold family protein [Bordetella holmesii ATCC 51541]EWM51187.1 alpha/beta hydrolase fold family protein [Bordetella holmesii 70147]EXF90043.1 alpha/beta hydrolase fold family protein [Bordetella holmesii 30539]KCV20455.1 putative lysophospholipase [Bordetella holmesii CDC-H643-BH]AMD49117.1 hydrolase [Bordetella holmesii F627]
MSPILLDPVLAEDGTPLARYRWPSACPRPGATAYILHGLGEYAGRHARLAQWLSARGWRVGAHDHRGHGRSGGPPAALRERDDLVRDATAQIAAFAAETGQAPLVIGHSLGALVALRLGLQPDPPVNGLVLSSPPLALRMPGWLLPPLRQIARRWPDAALAYPLAPARISHDPAVVQAFRRDPLARRCISGRLASFIDSSQTLVMAAAPSLSLPTLLLVAGDDRVVAAGGSRQFAQRAPAGLLTLRWYPHAWHEVFNERADYADPVYADLDAWLAGHLNSLEDTGPNSVPKTL